MCALDIPPPARPRSQTGQFVFFKLLIELLVVLSTLFVGYDQNERLIDQCEGKDKQIIFHVPR